MAVRSTTRRITNRIIRPITGDGGGGVSAPAFSIQPTSRTVTDTQEVTLTSLASGSPTYHWQISTNDGADWSNITDATSANYTFTADIDNDGNQYRVIATNAVDSTISSVATVNIINAALFDNDSVTLDNNSITFDQALV